MSEPTTCWREFLDEASGYTAVFDDDGRVAYAYLHDADQEIVGDVWLYNQCETPDQPEWTSPDKLPFANSSAYAKEHAGFRPMTDPSEVSVVWVHQGRSVREARLFLRGEFFAVLAEGAKPGWCVLAKKDGPLAKVLDSHHSEHSSQK